MPVPAFLVPILAQGLNLVANAALVKGKQWVKEKTGVDLEEGNLSSEDFLKLKQFELDHELELTKLQQEDNKLEVEIEKAYLADVASARTMQVAALQQEDKFSKRFIYYFAIFWAVIVSLYIYGITFENIPEENVRFADTILGFILGTVVAQIVAFFYGSSRSSQRKDEFIGGVIKNVTGK